DQGRRSPPSRIAQETIVMGLAIRSSLARRDLAEIWHYIALDNPSAADALLDRIGRAINLLAEHPGLGPVRDDIKRGANLRSFPIKKYLILYRIIPGGIEIARIVHGARNLRALFEG